MEPIRGDAGYAPFLSGTNGRREAKEGRFEDMLKSFAGQVNDQLNEADKLVGEFAVGIPHDLHDIMIATEKASLSFKLLLQIRNKLLEAYQEIMRMQL